MALDNVPGVPAIIGVVESERTVTADYRAARDRLGELVHSNLLNTDDAEPVYLRYRATADDPDPVLGTITDGELVALAEHRCDLTALRAEVELRRVNASATAADLLARGGAVAAARWRSRAEAMQDVLDLIDKHTREGLWQDMTPYVVARTDQSAPCRCGQADCAWTERDDNQRDRIEYADRMGPILFPELYRTREGQ